jgi:hypothetical protein
VISSTATNANAVMRRSPVIKNTKITNRVPEPMMKTGSSLFLRVTLRSMKLDHRLKGSVQESE